MEEEKTIKWFKVNCSLYKQEIGIKRWKDVIEFLSKHPCFDFTITGQYSDLYDGVPAVYKDGKIWLNDKFFANELLEEYETNFINVADFGIVIDGALVQYLQITDDYQIIFWSGNFDTDKYAEVILPISNYDKDEYLKQFYNLLW